MPSFYPQAMNGHLPLTPPYTAPYDNPACNPPQYRHENYAQQPSMPPRLDSAMEYSQRYPPPPTSAQPSAYQRGSFQNLPPISSYYEPMGAPILPPLRMQDAYNVADRDYYGHYQQGVGSQAAQQQQAPPKEEPTTGGVSAKLDYDMERMTDFVTEAAQGIIQPGAAVHPSFRKWVSQVLTATRLPSATILLSLHYLTVRMRSFSSSIDKTDNQLYRLLAVSMILGSKFLDDNTFINRSWSDVSGIKVLELNNLEMQWLGLIGFDLHADPSDENGISLWIRAWKEYDARATSKARSARLSPLNTNVPGQKPLRSGSTPFQPSYLKTAHGTYTPLSSGSHQSASGTPYTSADPWNRPEQPQMGGYYSSGRFPGAEGNEYGYRYATGYSSEAQAGAGAQQYAQYSLPSLSSLTPSFYTPWNQNSWELPHAWGCHCAGCARPTNSYMMGSGFAPQPVVG